MTALRDALVKMGFRKPNRYIVRRSCIPGRWLYLVVGEDPVVDVPRVARCSAWTVEARAASRFDRSIAERLAAALAFLGAEVASE